MDRWKEVEREIENFRRFLYADFPALPVTEGYDDSDYDYERHCYGPLWESRKGTGLYQQQGVYLYYDGMGNLLYVGKTRVSFAKEMFKAWERSGLKGRARYIDLVPFDKYAFLCPALEDYLICRLKPIGNNQGCENDAPERACGAQYGDIERKICGG